MSKIKIFYDNGDKDSFLELEERIKKWIEESPPKEIISMNTNLGKISLCWSDEPRLVITLLYKEIR